MGNRKNLLLEGINMWIVGRLRGYNLRSRFSLALRWRGLLHGLRFLYALLERLHQVNDLVHAVVVPEL
jgi:hypothetical protein